MLVRFDAWRAGAKRRIHLLGSNPMILFTRRPMPAELRLQSDRESQKSEIYFTDYTMAGQPGGLLVLEVRRGHAVRRPDCQYIRSVARRLPSLFLRLHFDWATGALFVLKARPRQATRRDSQYMGSAKRPEGVTCVTARTFSFGTSHATGKPRVLCEHSARH